MKKRIVSILLAVLMTVSMMTPAAISAAAEEGSSPVVGEIPAALQNTSWKGEMTIRLHSEESTTEENDIYILQIGTDSACFTYGHETVILPFSARIEELSEGFGELLIFKKATDETEIALAVGIEDGAVLGILANSENANISSNGSAFRITTLRDVLGKVSGVYRCKSLSDNDFYSVRVAISSNEFRAETVTRSFEAIRIISDHTGYRQWSTETFAGGQPVFDDEPDYTEENGTIESILSFEVTISEENITLPNGTVVPAGSYVSEETGFVFCDERSGKTQKMHLDGIWLDRIGEGGELLTLRDISGKIRGTYSSSDGEFSFIMTISENEFRIDEIAPDYAQRTVIDKTGMKYWDTAVFDENGQPVFSDEPDDESEFSYLDTLLDMEVTVTQEEIPLPNGSVVPAGSYISEETGLVFCDEQSGKTQKMCVDGMWLDRVDNALTLRDIASKVGGTYSGCDEEESVTMTISEDEFRIDEIAPDYAQRTVIDKTGMKYWGTAVFDENGQPVFSDEPDEESEFGNLDTLLDMEITIAEEDITLPNGIVVPAGSYVSEETGLVFCDEQNGKTQKMHVDGIWLDRVGDALTLRDIVGKVGGTYSFSDDSGTSLTATIGEDEFRFELVDPTANYALKQIVNAAGSEAWGTTYFENGKPVYGENSEKHTEPTINSVMDCEIEITEEDTAGIPAGSYVLDLSMLSMVFFDEDEESGKTQKMLFSGVELDRVGDALTLRDIMDKVGGTYCFKYDSVPFITLKLNENELYLEEFAFGGAGKTIIDHTGTKEWQTYTFDEDGKPVYDEPKTENNDTIDILLDAEILITEEEQTLSDGTVIPAGSYAFGDILNMTIGMGAIIFYDEDEQTCLTQKMYFPFIGVLERVSEHEHEFSAVEYTWDGAECTATAACTGCSETVTETKTGEFRQDTAATCTEAAKGHYEVTFDDTQFGSAQTEANSAANGDPDPDNHTAEGRTPVEAQAATCQHIGWDAYEVCACGEKLNYKEYPITGHVDLNGDFICDNCTQELLAEAKADAKAAIDSTAGAKQNNAVKQLVAEAKELIDKAETVEEVFRIQNDYAAEIKKESAPRMISVSVDKTTVIRGENAVWTVVTTPSADYIRFVSNGEALNFAKGMTNVETAENEDENTVWTITTRMTYTDAAKLEEEQTFTLACRSTNDTSWAESDSEITVKVKKYDESNAVNSEDYAPYSIVSASAIGGKKLGFTPITVVTTKDVTKLRFTVGSKTVTYTEASANTTVTADPEDENLIIWTIGYRFTAAGDYTVKIESRGTTWNTETVDAAVKIFATQAEADEYNNK